MKIKNDIIQLGEDYSDILSRPCLPVNLRLYADNKKYRSIVRDTISHMTEVLHSSYEDYHKLYGISGANVGIPFNIVIVKNNGRDLVMINPEIVERSEESAITNSNCGSINLEKPIKVRRSKSVRVVYYDVDLIRKDDWFSSGTVQHEIDHNKGIIITDRRVDR